MPFEWVPKRKDRRPCLRVVYGELQRHDIRGLHGQKFSASDACQYCKHDDCEVSKIPLVLTDEDKRILHEQGVEAMLKTRRQRLEAEWKRREREAKLYGYR